LIREWREQDALELLDAFPQLATGHSTEGGQLQGATPLHWAAHRNMATLCERLIELGASVHESASSWWRTPLAWGADAGSAEAVDVLLAHGADVNQDAVMGTTALHAAGQGGSTWGRGDPAAYRRTAELLIAYGADVTRPAAGDRRQTPLDDALASGNDAVADVLRRHRGLPSAPGSEQG
jgi:ankyrin repeat protein